MASFKNSITLKKHLFIGQPTVKRFRVSLRIPKVVGSLKILLCQHHKADGDGKYFRSCAAKKLKMEFSFFFIHAALIPNIGFVFISKKLLQN